MTKPATAEGRRIEILTALTAYHASEKIKVGAHYVAKPPEPASQPEVPNPVTEGLNKASKAFWELSKIHKELAGKL
jgi:hypothetical protein